MWFIKNLFCLLIVFKLKFMVNYNYLLDIDFKVRIKKSKSRGVMRYFKV